MGRPPSVTIEPRPRGPSPARQWHHCTSDARSVKTVCAVRKKGGRLALFRRWSGRPVSDKRPRAAVRNAAGRRYSRSASGTNSGRVDGCVWFVRRAVNI
jgi:hypothetical protein